MTITRKKNRPRAVDLFSGCGGLTLGLKRAGFNVIGAVELDELAQETYQLNHPRTRLFKQDIRSVDLSDLVELLGGNQLELLAGCPPCQGFSSMRTRNGNLVVEDERNDLVFEFARFAEALRPRLIMMENVPSLASDTRITKLTKSLQKLGYNCKTEVFDARHFGAAQRRRRMIFAAAFQGEVGLARPNKRSRTVRSVIGKIEPPSESHDPLHNYQVKRSPRIEQIFKAIPKNGGSRSDLPDDLALECHKGLDGFRDVYGRMAWDKPSPTITGGCINPSRGRFLHPTENRAITLREAALLQGFPKSYRFSLSRGRYPTAQMIGNAFPPIFAEKHARVLKTLLMT